MLIPGAVLSTVTELLGPAAGLGAPPSPAAAPAATEMLSVPSPVIPVIVTRRSVMPLPDTLTVPFAVPVLFSVTCEAFSTTDSASVKCTPYVTGPEAVSDGEGRPISTERTVLSTVNVALGPAASAVLPAASTAVPAASEMPRVPSPVMPLTVTVRDRPEPDTPTVAFAVPVLFSVTCEESSVTVLPPA